MTLRLALTIDGDATGAKQALGETARGVEQLGRAASDVDKLSGAFRGLEGALTAEVATLNRQSRAAAAAIEQLRFEAEQLKRNTVDRAAYEALRRAGVSASSGRGTGDRVARGEEPGVARGTGAPQPRLA